MDSTGFSDYSNFPDFMDATNFIDVTNFVDVNNFVNSNTFTEAADITDDKPKLTHEERRENHVASERRRRGKLRQGLDHLAELVPDMKNQAHREAGMMKATVQEMKAQNRKKKELRRLAMSLGVTEVDFEWQFSRMSGLPVPAPEARGVSGAQDAPTFPPASSNSFAAETRSTTNELPGANAVSAVNSLPLVDDSLNTSDFFATGDFLRASSLPGANDFLGGSDFSRPGDFPSTNDISLVPEFSGADDFPGLDDIPGLDNSLGANTVSGANDFPGANTPSAHDSPVANGALGGYGSLNTHNFSAANDFAVTASFPGTLGFPEVNSSPFSNDSRDQGDFQPLSGFTGTGIQHTQSQVTGFQAWNTQQLHMDFHYFGIPYVQETYTRDQQVQLPFEHTWQTQAMLGPAPNAQQSHAEEFGAPNVYGLDPHIQGQQAQNLYYQRPYTQTPHKP